MPETDAPSFPPFFRESGAGDAVVCLHANASTSSQYRGLMELLAPRFHVLAPDLRGAGQSPAYPTDRGLSLAEEAALLEPVFARAKAPFVLVGHSYGGAVALVAAVRAPQRVRALVLFEPTLFSLVDARSPSPNAADGIRNTVAAAVASLGAGDADAAAGRFIDYWMGAGTWSSTPTKRREAIAATIVHIQSWADALFEEPTSLGEFARLMQPVLLLTGRQSPPSARAVANLLASTLPDVALRSIDGVGHMGPVTHPELINPVIAEFVDRVGRHA